jgi:hypothetical protein
MLISGWRIGLRFKYGSVVQVQTRRKCIILGIRKTENVVVCNVVILLIIKF